MRVHVLAMHAGYRCRHAGVCCNEDWTIPVERARHERLTRAIARKVLRPERRARHYFLPLADGEEAAVVARVGSSCAFFEPAHGRLCAVHRTLGHDAMPAACQHFPRVVTIDPRGVFVSLSHVCPTAGALLEAPHPAPFAIVNEGLVLGAARRWAGLDASAALPPQVNARALWDWDGLTAWEACVLSRLGSEPPEAALAAIADAAARLSRWSPAAGSLADCVRHAFERASGAGAAIDVPRLNALAREAAGASSPAAPPAMPVGPLSRSERGWRALAPHVARYLAARAVASEVAYHATEVGVLSGWLDTVYAVLRVEIARRAAGAAAAPDTAMLAAAAADADRLLVHRLDAARLARSLAGPAR